MKKLGVKALSVLAIGAAHPVYDERSSRSVAGGGAFEIARSAVQAGAASALLSLRGGDAAGARIAAAIKRAGVEDLSVTFLTSDTPSAERIGDEIILDRTLYQRRFSSQVRRQSVRQRIAEADAVVIDEMVPPDAAERILTASAKTPVFAVLSRSMASAAILQLGPDRYRAVFIASGDRFDFVCEGCVTPMQLPGSVTLHRLVGKLLAQPGFFADPAGMLTALAESDQVSGIS